MGITSVRETDRNLHTQSSSLDLRNEDDGNPCKFEILFNEFNIAQKV